MLKLHHLRKSFNGHVALNDLSLHIPEGQIFGLLGPNGAGKTTLISIINGIIRPDSGAIQINGMDLSKQEKQIKAISALVPQHNAFYPTLTALENLEYFSALYGLSGKAMADRIQHSVQVASLQDELHRRAETYSGGLKRRLNLAIGLLNEPKILYLDEPTTGVDPQTRNHLLETIRSINKERGTTIVYTSHYIDEVEQICDHIGIIDHGQMITTDTTANLTSGTDCITIKLDRPLTDHQLIKDKVISISGNEVYIPRSPTEARTVAAVVAYCAEKNIKVTNVLYGYKKLEDIFLQLTSKELRDSA